MGVRHRASRLLMPLLVGVGSAHCSLTLDLDRYSFGKPGRGGSAGAAGSALAGQGGDAGEGGRTGGEGGMGDAAAGGSAGSGAGRGGGGASGSGNGGGGGESGGAAGASGEGGEGGAPEIICNDETGPNEPLCELVPVAVYVTLSGGCTGPVALGVDALGRVSSTLTTTTTRPMPTCPTGDIVITPDRGQIVALNGGGTGQITFTYDIDPGTFALTESQYNQFESDAPLSAWDDAAIRKGPPDEFDYLFITNEADNGEGGGLHPLKINRGQARGAIQALGLRETITDARGVAVHPTRNFVYVIQEPYSLSGVGIVGLTFGTTGTTGSVPSVPPISGVSGDIPSQLLINPAGTVLYLLTDLRVRSFTIDMTTGSLASYSTTSNSPTENLERMALHPNGSFLYVAGEDELVAFALSGGTLTPLDLDRDMLNGVTGKALPDIRDLEVDASGRFLFLTTPTTTLSFTIDADGLLGADPLMPSVDQPGLRLAVLDEWRLKP